MSYVKYNQFGVMSTKNCILINFKKNDLNSEKKCLNLQIDEFSNKILPVIQLKIIFKFLYLYLIFFRFTYKLIE